MDSDFANPEVAMGAFSAAYFVVFAAFYLVTAFAFMKIAEKTGTPNGWYAFVPVLNIILGLQMAQKPTWWLILTFVPVVNVFISIAMLMSIAERCGRPNWWGVVMGLVPGINLVLLYAMAFSKGSPPSYPQRQAPAA